MKERIILNKEKVIAFRPKGLDVYSQEYIEEIDVIENTKKVEQVPETFEELKELCKELEGKKIITTSTGIIIEDDYIEFHGLQFLKSGTISHETEIDKGLAIRLNRTPKQMWQIIKNLIIIGEE